MSTDFPFKATVEAGSKIHLSWAPRENLALQVMKIYFEKQIENLVQVVRVYEANTTELNDQVTYHFFEFPISYDKGQWSVKGMMPNKSYYAEIGVKLSESQYFPFLQSNTIYIPSTSIFDEHQEPLSHMHQDYLITPKWFEHVSTYSYYKNTSTRISNE